MFVVGIEKERELDLATGRKDLTWDTTGGGGGVGRV